MMKFTVYASSAQEVAKRLDRLAKKAAGYKIPFSYEVGEEYPKAMQVMATDPDGTYREVERHTVAAVDFMVECDDLIKANGWTVCAKIEHGEKGNIVTGFGNHEIRPEWYTVASNCDHCHVKRFRSVTFMCENENGEVRQVGRTCLKDYTGINPATAAMWAEVRDMIGTSFDCTTEEWENHRSGQMYGLVDILAHAFDAISEFGYRKSGSDQSTKGETTKRVLEGKRPSEEGRKNAAAIREWLEGLDKVVRAEDEERRKTWNEGRDRAIADGYTEDEFDNDIMVNSLYVERQVSKVSDLERNCIPLALSGYAKMSHVGRLAYMPVAYKKYLERVQWEADKEAARKAAAETSSYVGGVGERLMVKIATVELITSWDGTYGTTWLYKFTDESGNVFVWYASRPCDAEGGATIKATVKGHKERDGVKQTILTRCQVAA